MKFKEIKMKSSRIEYDKYFMILAKIAASRSGCNSRPTGAIIVHNKRVIATGYNGTIAGEPQCTDNDNQFCLRRSIGKDDKGEKKYQDCPSIHAEQNAINQIAKYGGVKLLGSEIYCTLFPCIICLKQIASVGIKKIYYELIYESDDKERDEYWRRKASDYNIVTEKIIIDGLDIRRIQRTLIGVTSKRRLQET